MLGVFTWQTSAAEKIRLTRRAHTSRVILTRKTVAEINNRLAVLARVARRAQALVGEANLIDTQRAMLAHVREAVVDGELAESTGETVQALTKKISLNVNARGVVEAKRHRAYLTLVHVALAVDASIALI